jgi:protein gp37
LFHEKVPGYFIDDVFATMSACPQHIFQILTKRPERMKQHLIEKHYSNRFREDYGYKGPWPLPNVWIGTSVENQETADERIPILLDIPAAIRWLSIEPQLGDIDLQPFFEQWPDHNGVRIVQNSNGVDWVVVGGESGKTSKVVPYCLSWTRNVIHDCRNAGVPLFVKQLGRRPYDIPEDYDGDDWPIWLEYKLKHLKGGDWDEWPDDYLKIREYPEL